MATNTWSVAEDIFLITKRNDVNELHHFLANSNYNVDVLIDCNFTPLMYAATRGFKDVIKLLLVAGAYADHQSTNGKTALLLAARKGHIETVKVLLDAGANIDHKNKLGFTPLMCAAEKDHRDCVKALIAAGCKIDIQNEWGYTALLLAAEEGFNEVVKILINAKANKNHRNKAGWSSLMLASDKGFTDIVRFLLENCVVTDFQDKDYAQWGHTSLMRAAKEGHKDVVRLLLLAKANTEFYNQWGNTALMMAAQNGHIDVMKLLIEHGADKDHQNEDGDTALWYAVRKGHKDSVKLLLDYGANKEYQDERGHTALLSAAEEGHVDVVRLLLLAGANREHKDKWGNTALMLAVEKRNKEIVALLLEFSAQMEYLDKDDQSFLMAAVQWGYFEVVKLLIGHGADVNQVSKEGYTALWYAVRLDQVEIVQLLLENGAETDFKRKLDGNTCLAYSVKHSKIETMRLLLIAGADPLVKNDQLKMPFEMARKSDLRELFVTSRFFTTYMHAIKSMPCLNVLHSLVGICVALKITADAYPLEVMDIMERMEVVEKMMVECIRTDSMDDPMNVVRVLRWRSSSKDVTDEILMKAELFLEGPLCLCITNRLTSILGIRQVSYIVDSVLWGSLKKPRNLRSYKPVVGVSKLNYKFQMRSSSASLRGCPIVILSIEGLSKLALLILVSYLSVNENETIHPVDASGQRLEMLLIVMVWSQVLHSIGLLHQHKWSIPAYFDEVWNYIDFVDLSVLFAWTIMKLVSWGDPHATYWQSLNNNIHNNNNFENAQWIVCDYVADAQALLAFSAIPTCLALLRYFSIYLPFGQLVLMIFAFALDLGFFMVVFLTCVTGFWITFHALWPENPNFATPGATIITMVNAGLSNPNLFVYADGTDRYYTFGLLLMICFSFFTVILLLNIVTANFSATFDKINEKSFQTWSMMKARIVQQHLLTNEKSPLSMLPPPFNLIPILFMPFHYAKIYFYPPIYGRVMSISGTASDIFISLLNICPFAAYEVYLLLKEQHRNSGKLNIDEKFSLWISDDMRDVLVVPIYWIAFLPVVFMEIISHRSVIIADHDNWQIELRLDYSHQNDINKTESSSFEDNIRKINPKYQSKGPKLWFDEGPYKFNDTTLTSEKIDEIFHHKSNQSIDIGNTTSLDIIRHQSSLSIDESSLLTAPTATATATPHTSSPQEEVISTSNSNYSLVDRRHIRSALEKNEEEEEGNNDDEPAGPIRASSTIGKLYKPGLMRQFSSRRSLIRGADFESNLQINDTKSVINESHSQTSDVPEPLNSILDRANTVSTKMICTYGCDDNCKDGCFYTQDDRTRIFYGIYEGKRGSYAKNPFAFEIHTNIEYQLHRQESELRMYICHQIETLKSQVDQNDLHQRNISNMFEERMHNLQVGFQEELRSQLQALKRELIPTIVKK